MNDRPSNELIEDVLGCTGFRLVWIIDEYRVSVTAYSIVAAVHPDMKPVFNLAGYVSSDDETDDHTKAEPYLAGSIKWDGCSHFTFEESMHLCGAHCFRDHTHLMVLLYHRAFQLMNREPDETWVYKAPPEALEEAAKVEDSGLDKAIDFAEAYLVALRMRAFSLAKKRG